MEYIDNHAIKLHNEIINISKNLNKFRKKNHKTISKIINNLNYITNNIDSKEDIGIKALYNGHDNNLIISRNKYKSYSLPKRKKKTNPNIKLNKNKRKNSYNNINYNKSNNFDDDKKILNNFSYNNISSNQKYNLKHKFNIKQLNFEENKKNFEHFLNNDLNIKKYNYTQYFNKYDNINTINTDKYSEDNKMNNKFKSRNNLERINNYFNTELDCKKQHKDYLYFNRKKKYNEEVNPTNFNIIREYKNFQNPKGYNSFFDNYTNDFKKKNYKHPFTMFSPKENMKIVNHNDDINQPKQTNIKDILKLLNVDNIIDAKDKIERLIKLQDFVDIIISIYLKNNVSNKTNDDNINLNDIIFWVFNCTSNNDNNKYEKYCTKLMNRFNINNFDEFKQFINKNVEN